MDNKYLKENLLLKKPLKCKDGKFRIVVFSDLHGVVNFDRRILRDLTAIVDGMKPDLVLFNGDMVWGDAAQCRENLLVFLSAVDKVLSDRKIPWAHVFGNHDREKRYGNSEQMKVYCEFEYCISKQGPDDVDGIGNFVLPVMSTDGNRPIYNVWGIDSGGDIDDFLRQYDLDPDKRKIHFQDQLYTSGNYDCIRFSQMLWYWQSSVEFEKEYGEKIPGMMFFHEAFPEFQCIYKNPQYTNRQGVMRETVGCGPLNSGLLAELVQRGDVKTVICGHDHINDFEGDILGVHLAMDAGLSYDGYCDDDLRGGRVVDITENDPWNVKTYMVRSSDFVKDYPGDPIRQEN